MSKHTPIWRVTASVWAGPRFVTKGDILDPDDPLVETHPGILEDLAAPKEAAHAPLEAATANPGEQRPVTPPAPAEVIPPESPTPAAPAPTAPAAAPAAEKAAAKKAPARKAPAKKAAAKKAAPRA